MFSNRPPRHEEEIKKVRQQFYDDMNRIEALVLDGKVRGRSWNDEDRQSARDTVDRDRYNSTDNP